MAQYGAFNPAMQAYQGVYGMPPGFNTGPAPYSPAAALSNIGGQPSPLLALLATSYLSQATGSNNFLPHMMPGQAMADQFMMRQYQAGALQNTFNTNKMGNQHVAHMMLGMRSVFSNTAATELNKEGANNLAGVLTNPFMKQALGGMIGPENLEGLMYGRAGDPTAIAGVANKLGYYRRDPAGGAKRMSASSLEDFSRGLYAQLYMPEGNVNNLVTDARDELSRGPAGSRTKALREAANMPDTMKVLSDSTVASRLAGLDEVKLDSLYKQYKHGGTATTAAQKATELKEFDRAVTASGVLDQDETTVGVLGRRARDRNLDSAMGFSAGQSSQIAENLFQRGMLPQSIGALSPADRVKLLGSHSFDNETMNRMAEEFGHRDLMKSEARNADGKRYSDLTEEQQREELRKRVTASGGYRDKMDSTFSRIKDYNKNGAGSGFQSAEEVERLAGADLMSNNVDASRVSKVVKEKMGAVDAIREIFGDNGNPNAPVPALLAALDHLSQGAMSQMSSGKVEHIIRQMRGTAKEMGIGFEQLAGFSAQMGAAGANLGLHRPTTLQATNASLVALNTMRQAGVFANPQFGAMSQEEAMQSTGMAVLRGQRSANAMSIGALARIYELNPEKYAGTELEAAVKAAQDPSTKGEYTVKDAAGNVVKTGNVFTTAGREGANYARRLARDQGISDTAFSNLMTDSLTGEYVPDAAGFMTQRQDVLTQITNRTLTGRLRSEAAASDKNNTLSQNTVEGNKQRYAISEKLAELMLDSANFSTEKERVDHLRKNAHGQFKAALMANGVTDEAEADRQAKFAYESYFGKGDEASQGVRAQSLLSAVNNMTEYSLGANMVVLGQQYGIKAQDEFGTNLVAAGNRARLEKSIGAGLQSTVAQRFSDYMAEIGRTSENFNVEELSKVLGGVIPVDELRRRFSPEMQAGAAATHRMRKGLIVSGDDVKNADDAKLREYGKIGDDVAILDEAEIKERRKAKLVGMKDDEVKDLHRRYIKDSSASTKDQQIAELMRHTESNYVYGLNDKDVAGDKAISRRDAQHMATRLRAGTLIDDTPKGRERLQRIGLMERAVLESKTKDDASKGMTEFIRHVTDGKDLTPEQLTDLTNAGMDATTDKEKTAFNARLRAITGRDLTADETAAQNAIRMAGIKKPGEAGHTATGDQVRNSLTEFLQKAAKDSHAAVSDTTMAELTEKGARARTDTEKKQFEADFEKTMGRKMGEDEKKKVAEYQQTAKEDEEKAKRDGGLGGMTGAVSDGIETGLMKVAEKFVGAIAKAIEDGIRTLGDTFGDRPAAGRATEAADTTKGATAAGAAASADIKPAEQPKQGTTAATAPVGVVGEQELSIVGTLDVPGFGKALLSARAPSIITPPNGGAAINFSQGQV